MTTWNPDAYLKYEDERTQPSRDLVARIGLANPSSIIDIGCGPGNSTAVLRGRWPHARIAGLDSSSEMIARARDSYPQERWVLANAATWETGERFDLVFSNAALQWIPQHEPLLRRLFDLLSPQGVLAVQVPANNDSPLHKAIVCLSHGEEWHAWMDGCDALLTYHDASFYYDHLSVLAKRLFMWQTTYYHVMADHQGLIAWYASTGMRPYLERLPSIEQRQAFQEQVLAACRPHYPRQGDGRILFPFRRLFFVAYKE